MPGRVKMLPVVVSVLGGKHASQGGPLFLTLQALVSFSEFCCLIWWLRRETLQGVPGRDIKGLFCLVTAQQKGKP